MEIPVIIFLSLVGLTFSLAIVGFWKKIPMLVLLGGFMMFFTAVITDTVILDYFQITDTSQIMETTIANTTSLVYVVDSSVGTDLVTFNAATGFYGRGEIAGASSILIGQDIQCISIDLKKSGTGSGILTAGFWGTASVNPFITIGTLDTSTLTTSYVTHEFCLPEGSEVQVTGSFVFGFTVSGGDAAGNNIMTKRDTTNPFDGINTQRGSIAFGGAGWTGVSTEDSTMRAYDLIPVVATTEDFVQTVEPQTFPLDGYAKVLFILISALISVSSIPLWKYSD